MKRLITIIVLLALFINNNCNNSKTEIKPKVGRPRVKKDLQKIKEEGVLKAIVVYSGTSYFLYRGQVVGFEYDLLQRLAEYLDLKLQIIVAHNINELITMLNKGKGDIIAHGLTITQDRKEYVNFTDRLYFTRQVLVQRKPAQWRKMTKDEIQKTLISNPVELINDTVSVRKNSSYYRRLLNLEEEIGGNIYINTVTGTTSTGEIIEQVAKGDLEYTVADKNIADIIGSYYPILNSETDISLSQRIAWAVRKNSPKLLSAVNNWLNEMKQNKDYYVLYNKYFKNKHNYKDLFQSDFYSRSRNKISKYDSLIKKHSQKFGWDWRLVSSVIYQESQFNPQARSWARARGLMQIMPRTAGELNISNVHNPDQNIRGGIQYLEKLSERWTDIPDSIQQLKFTLASYNSGYKHIRDGQNLTKKYGENPQKWDDNVEKYVLKLSFPKYYKDEVVNYGYARGIETVTYVKQIFKRYEHYTKFIQE